MELYLQWWCLISFDQLCSTLQEKFHDVERQLKESMLSNAQLYKEKTALVFQVENLKDR